MKLFRMTLLLLALMCLTGPSLSAQTVIFPQQKQPGKAKVSESRNGTVTLSNALLTAVFTDADGSAMFGGCRQLGLLPGTELFTLVLRDSTEIPASKMKLTGWGTESLKGDPKATVASQKLPGKAVKGTFTYGDLRVDWRAVLRDGSHYLRTEMTISASKDTKMHAVIAMQYRGKTAPGAEMPKVTGNTRGSILASPELFAGLETPTGINSVVTDENAADGAFTLQGLWSRHATLQASRPWEISSVVGIMAPGQQRRSVLAYSERERAVPWRAFPLYNSWYELNIDRNNAADYSNHMTSDD